MGAFRLDLSIRRLLIARAETRWQFLLVGDRSFLLDRRTGELHPNISPEAAADPNLQVLFPPLDEHEAAGLDAARRWEQRGWSSRR